MPTASGRNTVHITAAALAALSAAYYALYIDAGFNYADDGNYAQTAFELFLGRSPLALDLSYGLAWYQTGAGLFHLFGVDFLLVRLLFFGAITLTTLLVFYSLAGVSGSLLLAALLAGVIALVPAFPATAFYGLCVALNAAAQLRLASRLGNATSRDGALAGAAVGVSFQIRPDFGLVFAGALAVIALTLFWPQRRSAASSVAAGMILGFLAVALPAAGMAFAGGYEAILARQYLDYPKLLAGLLVNGLTGGAGPGPSLTLLARPGLSTPGLAALVYGPIAFFALCFGYILIASKTLKRDAAAMAQVVTALAAGVATFPHYFFYRPDLSHIANFMPGFVVMLSVFLSLLKREGPPRAAAAGAGLAGLYLVLYLAIGLPSRATGSIGMAAGRGETFTAANGVKVRVAPEENAQLVFLRDTIEANTRPGDAIVCLPYCPGVAFMTGRRMLLDNFYVDDTFPQLRPQWLSKAIAETRAARPPIVLVQDWAINGTEQSRFSRWAGAYVEAVKELARDTVTGPATTAYLIDPAPPSN